ncbi:MAG: GH116 family glycosyl-hydrolase [Candidatus Margulisiibacteriota bacterium]
MTRIEEALIKDHGPVLVEKGILDPAGKKIINKKILQKLIDEAQKTAGSDMMLAVNLVLQSLGQSQDTALGIPSCAYDTTLAKNPYGTYGQSRIAYMRMSGMPTDGSKLGIVHGGFGTGGVMRAPDGSFPTVDFIEPGRNIYDPQGNMASQFHVYFKRPDGKTAAQTLYTGKPADEKKLGAWKWNYPEKEGSYHALYPKTWWEYPDQDFPAKVSIKAFSPIIAKNYKETSYPVVVYTMRFKNTSRDVIETAGMFTFQNMVGWTASNQNTWDDKAARMVETPGIQPLGGEKVKLLVTEFEKHSKGNYNFVKQENGITAVVMTGEPENPESSGQIAIAAKNDPRVKVSYVSRFDADGSGSEVAGFFENGALPNTDSRERSSGENLGGAIAVSVTLKPGEEIEIPFVLTYDMPATEFKKGTIYKKKYTEYFGDSGKNAAGIASEALSKYMVWEKMVDDWQRDILSNSNIPDWFKGELLNTLSLLQSNAIFYGNIPSRGYDLHIMGESNRADYKHAETRDVGVYSPARAMLWPEMHNNLMKHYAWSVLQDNQTMTAFNLVNYEVVPSTKDWTSLSDKQKTKRIVEYLTKERKETLKKDMAALLAKIYFAPLKPKGATPHDIGAYDTDPALDLNSYTHQNPNVWSELSMVWILEAYRNYCMGNKADKKLIESIYPSVKASLQYAEKMDRDRDHIPDHQGIPDWTYDNWKVKGINSYTGGLWLVALEAGIEMARITGDAGSEKTWDKWLEKGKKSFDSKLWDKAKGYYHLGKGIKDVFADSLWMLWPTLTDLSLPVPEAKAKQHLRHVFSQNVAGFGNGYMGAVNGTRNGMPIEGEQEREMWTGTSFALGAAMLALGLNKEAWQTIYGTYNMTTNLAKTFPVWAEAYTQEPGMDGDMMIGFRAMTYFRVLAIWNILRTQQIMQNRMYERFGL